MDTAPCETKHQIYKGLANKNYDTIAHHRAWSEAVAIRMVISSHEQLRTFFAEQAEVFIGKPTRCTYGAGLSYRAVRLHGRHWTQGDFLLEPVPRQILRCLKDSADRPVRRVRNAFWWFCENEDVVRALP